MSPHSSGPRRSESVESYLRQTRLGATLALLALAAAIASEQFAEHLWVRHPLLAGLASSAIVVMLSVAVVNEALEIRRRRRWTVLAQRLVAITQLAEQLDRGTLKLAVKIVPVAWWEARLGTNAHVGDDVPEANGHGQLSPTRVT